jgi:twitching motility protein PilT
MNRMISLVDGASDDLRERLADTLQGIIAQRLLPRADGNGMVLAAEVLVVTGSVREALKRPLGNPPLKELMEGGEHPYGMQTFEKHVRRLVKEAVVSKETARQATGF